MSKILFNLDRPRQADPDTKIVFDSETGIVFEERDKKTLVYFPGVVSDQPFYVKGNLSQVVESVAAQWGNKKGARPNAS